jgi:hypothetical protein
MLNALSPKKAIGAAFRHAPPLVFVCCVLITALILVRSDILFTVPWSPILWSQALKLFAVVGFVAAVTAIAAMFFRLRLELLLALMATAMIALFCGPAPTAIVLFFLLSAACLATLLLYPFGGIEATPFNLRIVVGWAIFGIIFTLLASLRIHTAAVHTMMLGMPILFAVAIPAIRDVIWLQVREMFRLSDGVGAPGFLYTAGFVVCIVILSFHLALVALPERYFDALVTHLYIPSFIEGHQAWNYDINNYAFANLVMAVDFLYANMFLLQGEQAVRLLNFVALLFTCIAIFQIAARTCSRTAAIWTVALFVSLPLTLIESTSLFVEHTIALFVVSATLALVLSGFRVTLLGYAIVLILLAAATMSKLHGALGAVVIGTASSALYLRQRRQRSEYVKFSVASLVAVGVALWPYIHSWRNTGNPVFPFFNRVFKSPYYPMENFVDPRWADTLSPWLLFDTTFHSSRFLEAGDGVLGFSFFIFLAAGLVGAIYLRNTIVLFCAGLGLLIIGIISLQSPYLRYLFIFTPLLMIGVAFAMNELGQSWLWRVPVGAVAAMVVLLNVYKFPTGGWVIGGSDLRGVFDSGVRRELELGQAPERIANRVINDMAGSDAKVLYLANPFGALLVGTAIYDNWYNTAYGRDFANITSEQDFETVLRRIAPTHVIFDPTKEERRYAIAGDYLRRKATLVAPIGRLLIYRLSLGPE